MTERFPPSRRGLTRQQLHDGRHVQALIAARAAACSPLSQQGGRRRVFPSTPLSPAPGSWTAARPSCLSALVQCQAGVSSPLCPEIGSQLHPYRPPVLFPHPLTCPRLASPDSYGLCCAFGCLGRERCLAEQAALTLSWLPARISEEKQVSAWYLGHFGVGWKSWRWDPRKMPDS